MLKQKIYNLVKLYNIRPQKKMGQNFLISDTAAALILEAAAIQKDNAVVEIGPGLGSLTGFIISQADIVYAIEKDRKLSQVLQEEFKDVYNLKIICADFLKISLADLKNSAGKSTGCKFKIIGNIPYYITSPILVSLIEQREYVSDIVLTVQADVAERVTAQPKSRQYGRLTCLVQYYFAVEIITEISAKEFYPAPAVESKVIKLKPRPKPKVLPRDEKLFFKIIKAGFSQRRKMLINPLKSCFPQASKEELCKIFKTAQINEKTRAEELSLEDFTRLADVISDFDFKNLR